MHNYAREPGVRSIKKFVNRIMEKIAFKITESDNPHNQKIIVDEVSIEDFIGSPIFSSKKIYPV